MILGLDDREAWRRAEVGASPSQGWRYASALRLSGFDPRLAIVDSAGSRLLLPFIERRFGAHKDISTLPGLSGASIIPSSAAPLMRWREVATDHGWVSGYIQLSAETYPNVPAGCEPVHQTHAFLIDPSAWTHGTASRTIRQKVAAALRAGAAIGDDRPALGEALTRLYPETLKRFGTTSILSSDTLLAWAADPENLVMGLSVDGHVEGVHLIHVHERAAEFHLAGMSRRGRPFSAFLYVAVLERLRDMGVTRFNLGGGGNPGDGLYLFKSWLGARPVPIQSLRHVYRRAEYDALCEASSADRHARWFPSYRAATTPQKGQPKG